MRMSSRPLSLLVTVVIATVTVLSCGESDAAQDVDVTAYVLAYHWGFILFDENGQEMETLQVELGDRVRLLAVNDHAFDAINALPDAVANAMLSVDLHARAREDIEAGLLRNPDDYGTSLERELAAVDDAGNGAGHDHGGHYIRDEHRYIIIDTYMDHGLRVTGLDARIDRIPSDAREPASVVFTANREGAFHFECTVACGFGHPHPRELLEVVP